MRAIYFLTTLIIGVTSISTSIFAQDAVLAVDPLERLAKPQFNFDRVGPSKALEELIQLEMKQRLANSGARQRAYQERELQRQGLEGQLEIEREKTRQLELQLKLRQQDEQN